MEHNHHDNGHEHVPLTTEDLPEHTHKLSEHTHEELKHKHSFIPLWMPILAFGLILISYLYCYLTETPVNFLAEVGAIGISGIFAVLCWYYDNKKD